MRVSTMLVACSMAFVWNTTTATAAHAQQAFDTTMVQGLDDTGAQRLFGELMSPFCPGLTLATCPSPGAYSLRRGIQFPIRRGLVDRSASGSS